MALCRVGKRFSVACHKHRVSPRTLHFSVSPFVRVVDPGHAHTHSSRAPKWFSSDARRASCQCPAAINNFRAAGSLGRQRHWWWKQYCLTGYTGFIPTRRIRKTTLLGQDTLCRKRRPQCRYSTTMRRRPQHRHQC